MDLALSLEFLQALSSLDGVISLGTIAEIGELSTPVSGQKQFGMLGSYGDFFSGNLADATSDLNDFSRYLASIEYGDPSLEGGVQTGIGAWTVSEGQEIGTYNAERTGTFVGVNMASAIASSLAAYGLSMTLSDSLNSESGREMLNNIVRTFDPSFNSTDQQELLSKITNSKCMLVCKDNTLYMPSTALQAIKDSLVDSSAYSARAEAGTMEEAGGGILTTANISYEWVKRAVNVALSKTTNREYASEMELVAQRTWSALNSSVNINDYKTMGVDISYSPHASGYSVDCSITLSTVNYVESWGTPTSLNGYTYNSPSSFYWLGNGDCITMKGRMGANTSGEIVLNTSTTGISLLLVAGIYARAGSVDNATWGVQITNVNGVVVEGVGGLTTMPDITVPTTGSIARDYPSWYELGLDIASFVDAVFDYPIENPIAIERVLPISIVIDPTVNPAIPTDIPQITAHVGTLPVTDVDVIPWTLALPNAITIPKNIAVPIEIAPWTPLPLPTPVVPPIPPVQGANNGFITIYNPNLGQLQAAGAELWSADLISDLKELFTNNPLDAVISLHIIYSPVSAGGAKEIMFGCYPSGVSAPVVTNQYMDVDCGSVSVPEVYGNATDYEPYTNVEVYLPFVGIVPLSANDVVGGTVNIRYRVDVYTGACLVTISVNKYNATCALYQYEGNCAVQIPLTGAQRTGLVAGLLNVAKGVAMGGVAGGVVSAIGSVASGLHKASVSKSGGFSSNAGAMGSKTPYLIINRTLPYDATRYNQLYGYPSNTRVTLANCTGFTQVKEVHTDTLLCTDNEKAEIEQLLVAGVFV